MSTEDLREWCLADSKVKNEIVAFRCFQERLQQSIQAKREVDALVVQLEKQLVETNREPLDDLDGLIDQRAKQGFKADALARVVASLEAQMDVHLANIGRAWGEAWLRWIQNYEKGIKAVTDAARVHLDALQKVQGCVYEPVEFEERKRLYGPGSRDYETKLPLDYRMQEQVDAWRNDLRRAEKDLVSLGRLAIGEY